MVRVALTFDDGPGPATDSLLDILAARNVRATFFLLGRNVERLRPVAIRLLRAGHLVGNHTYSHARPDAITPAELVAEVRRTDALLHQVATEAGVALADPIPVRLPYGPAAADPRLPALASLGRTHVHWTGDFHDWQDPDPEQLHAQLLSHVADQGRGGLDAVLDLHDSSRLLADRRATVEAVRRLLEDPKLDWFTVPAR
jgi:chitin deacetylase